MYVCEAIDVQLIENSCFASAWVSATRSTRSLSAFPDSKVRETIARGYVGGKKAIIDDVHNMSHTVDW